MCGIAGILCPQGQDIIHKMTEALVHRGPDGFGYFHDDYISLGQQRLSIIDVATGKQPISNETDTIQLICNGEIYNSPELRQQLIASGHRFKTSTDVEVILHLYEDHGKECVRYLRGMFAFAIWDSDSKRLLLARDHMGQKPLFFYQNGRTFAFASEIKGILASGLIQPTIDMEGLWHYVSMRFLPDRHSLFQKTQKLPAASLLLFENGKVEINRYWNLDFNKKLSSSENEIEEGLNSLLLETVKMHLLSDVRVGAFLSGGIDSSTVCAMMASITREPVPTFSIGVKEQDFNELPYARMVVRKYGLESHERVVEANAVDLIPSMIYHMDEPSDPFGMGVYLVSKVASEVVKVALGGDGGDENFAGYDRFAGNQLVDIYCLLPAWFRKSVMKKLTERIPESFAYKSFAQKAAWVNEISLFEKGERYAQSMSFLRFTQEAKEKLFTSSARNRIEDDDSVAKILAHYESENVDHIVDRMLYTDLMTRMPDHLLTIVDRMSMAHSLETRSPLIDYKVVEYAASIPAEMKLRGKNLKYILKKVAHRYLPEELINREKQGFGFPLGIWMRKELKDFLGSLFAQSRFVEDGIFNREYITHLLQEHGSGKANHDFRLWILMNLEIWYRMYFENESVESMKDYIKFSMGKVRKFC
jgi:asparagine synthase (glutamine-hydrolysing)